LSKLSLLKANKKRKEGLKMLGQFQKGESVLVYYGNDDLQSGVIVGTNTQTGNERLFYTVKVGNKYWVGEETKLFSPQMSAEDAAGEVEAASRKLEEEAQQRRTKLEEEQRRLEEKAAAAAAAEEAEETEEGEATKTTG